MCYFVFIQVIHICGFNVRKCVKAHGQENSEDSLSILYIVVDLHHFDRTERWIQSWLCEVFELQASLSFCLACEPVGKPQGWCVRLFAPEAQFNYLFTLMQREAWKLGRRERKTTASKDQVTKIRRRCETAVFLVSLKTWNTCTQIGFFFSYLE